jgi:hypothetical protein
MYAALPYARRAWARISGGTARAPGWSNSAANHRIASSVSWVTQKFSIAVASWRPSATDPLSRAHASAPADVVLLGNRDVVALAFRREAVGAEIRAFGDCEEVFGMPQSHVLRVRRLIEPLERVLADRVEHAEAAAAPPPNQALLDERLEDV